MKNSFAESDLLPLTEPDLRSLEAKNWIDGEYSSRAKLARATSAAGAALVGRNGNKDYGGVVFPYFRPGETSPITYRLRRDNPEVEYEYGQRKEVEKYLSAPTDRNHLYFLPGTNPEWLALVSIPIVMTEGEKKAIATYRLSWWGLGESAETPRLLAVGLSGVSNYRGTIGKEPAPNGGTQNVVGMIPDLDLIKWQGRRVVIAFDTNVRDNDHVKRSRVKLTRELERRGAIVSWFVWPEDTPAEVNGLDDFLALVQPQKVLDLLESTNGQEDTARNYIEFAPTFLSTVDPPAEQLVGDLLHSGVLALLHSEPRLRKSWAAVEFCVACTTATPAFGLPRFSIPKPVPVMYSSQEDDSRRVRERVKRLLKGRGVSSYPESLAFSIHAGINLEEPRWQAALIRDVKRFGFKLVVFDPIRRYSPNVDKGPAEVRQITAFLRRLSVEAETTVLVVHHDIKPSTMGADNRRRGHKASGGDWFAACECPIACESAGENRTLVLPEDFKFSVDPDPFTFELQEHDGGVRLVGETVKAEDATSLAIEERILQFLRESSGGASGNSIAKVCRTRRENVTDALTHLLEIGRVDSVKSGRTTKWFLRSVSRGEK